VDWSGDDALRINAILDEDAADDDLKVPDVFVMKDRIRQELRQHGIDLFPYVFFAKRSDLAAPVEDDE
jgi:hypothetical protein